MSKHLKIFAVIFVSCFFFFSLSGIFWYAIFTQPRPTIDNIVFTDAKIYSSQNKFEITSTTEYSNGIRDTFITTIPMGYIEAVVNHCINKAYPTLNERLKANE